MGENIPLTLADRDRLHAISEKRGPRNDDRTLVKHHVGSALHLMRVAKRMSQERVAYDLGELLRRKIRQSYVSKVEKGQINISIERLEAICEVLQCRPSMVMSVAESLGRDSGRPELELLQEAQAMVSQRIERMTSQEK